MWNSNVVLNYDLRFANYFAFWGGGGGGGYAVHTEWIRMIFMMISIFLLPSCMPFEVSKQTSSNRSVLFLPNTK